MRGLSSYRRRLTTTRTIQAGILLASLLVTGWVSNPFEILPQAEAAHPDAPVITSFSIADLGGNSWRLSGTVTASEGLEGMVLYFGGLVDEEDAPESNGTFSIDVVAQPIPGDWASVYAIDRFELQSDTVSEDFP